MTAASVFTLPFQSFIGKQLTILDNHNTLKYALVRETTIRSIWNRAIHTCFIYIYFLDLKFTTHCDKLKINYKIYIGSTNGIEHCSCIAILTCAIYIFIGLFRIIYMHHCLSMSYGHNRSKQLLSTDLVYYLYIYMRVYDIDMCVTS